MTAKRKLKVKQSLDQIVNNIDQWNGKDAATLISHVKALAIDAVDVLKLMDADLRQIGFIVLALKQSTDVKVSVINGKRLTKITILDKTIYDWALEEIHKLPEKLS